MSKVRLSKGKVAGINSCADDHGVIAARFHNGLIEAVAGMAVREAERHGCRAIALSGGAMQNRIVSQGLHRALSERGHTVLMQHKVPANDGGLALGQAVIAAARAIH